MRPQSWLWTVAAPLAILALLLAQPMLDAAWENHQAHSWLVLAAAARRGVGRPAARPAHASLQDFADIVSETRCFGCELVRLTAPST